MCRCANFDQDVNLADMTNVLCGEVQVHVHLECANFDQDVNLADMTNVLCGEVQVHMYLRVAPILTKMSI